jgi:hypothetical protein
MKVSKKELKKEIESLRESLITVESRLALLESKSFLNHQSPLLPVIQDNRCPQCNIDLSVTQPCNSINCPYSYQVTCTFK